MQSRLTDRSHIDGVSNCQMPILTVISGVKTTDVADAANPLIHLLFGVCHQIEDAINGLDVKYEAVLQVLLVECQPSVHLKGHQTSLSLLWHQWRKNKWLNVYSQSKRRLPEWVSSRAEIRSWLINKLIGRKTLKNFEVIQNCKTFPSLTISISLRYVILDCCSVKASCLKTTPWALDKCGRHFQNVLTSYWPNNKLKWK